jgi:hypothetical protein
MVVSKIRSQPGGHRRERKVDASTAYRLNIGELVARLPTDEHRGLSEAEARSRNCDGHLA